MNTESEAWKLLVGVEQHLARTSAGEAVLSEALLGKIGNFFQVDRVQLCLLNKPLTRLRFACQWCAPGYKATTAREMALEEGGALTQSLTADPGSRLIHTAPLIQSDALKGFLCLESYDSTFEWTSAHAALADQVARLLVKAPLDFKKAEIPEALSRTGSEPGPGAAESGDREIHILIVEDDDSNIFLIRKFIARFGATAHVARTGREAIDACNERRFDVILMDLSMPQLDGFDATRAIVTGTGMNRETPIVAVTADTTEGIERRCKKIGMSHYLSKPLRMDAIIGILTQLTGHKKEVAR